jgi:hypothetical protein
VHRAKARRGTVPERADDVAVRQGGRVRRRPDGEPEIR